MKKKNKEMPPQEVSVPLPKTGASESSLPQSISTNRIIVHPTSYWETLIHVLKGNIGAGLFAMGDAYKNSGYIGGLLGTLFIGGICIYCGHILIWSSTRIRTKLNIDADPSFEETVEYSFRYGPKWYQKSSRAASIIVKTFIVITQLGFCCVFFVFVANSIDDVVRANSDVALSSKVYMLCMYGLMMFICLIPFLKFLTPISAVGTACLFFGIVSIIVISSLDLPNPTTRKGFSSASTFPLFFGTVVYAFEGIALILPLRAEMRNPQNFEANFGVYNVGMAIVMILFNLVGFLGYVRYGEDVQGSISLNLSHSILSDAIKIIVALGVMFSFPIQFFVGANVVAEAILGTFENNPLSHKKKIIITSVVRGSLVTLTCLIALFVPELSSFISLIGAVSSTALALVFPVLCHISLFTCPDEYEPASSKALPLLFLLDSIAMILAILGFATGTYTSIKELVSKFYWDPIVQPNVIA